jgi:hypothetical protein
LDLLEVDFKKASPNPTWVLDGTSLLPMVKPGSDPNAPRSSPLIFSFGNKFEHSQQAIIDNDWKILTRPSIGQCDQQPGFNFTLSRTDQFFLFNLKHDVHESHDLAKSEPAQFERMSKLLMDMRLSINNSRYNEVKCCTADYCV